MNKKMSVCIVAHFAYGMMRGDYTKHVGGVERQTSLLSRWLSSRGHQVSLLTWDEDGEDEKSEVIIDGVRVIKICRQDAGLPGLRFFHPRWTGLIKALHRADADLYYQNCAEYVTGQVALWCRYQGRPFVYSVASDPDCDPGLPEMRTWRERVLYRYGLRQADEIIVQTERQKEMLLRGFQLASVALPMPCPGPSETEYKQPLFPEDGKAHIIWVGRITPVKRLELLLDVAEALPEIQFHVAGKPPSMDDAYFTNLHRRIQRLPNVTLHGLITPEQMPGFYQRASLFCCTSQYEGFPNSFLEAWSHGLPTISTYDPDRLISAKNLGTIVGNARDLTAAIQDVISSRQRWTTLSENVRRYYAAHHTVDQAMPQFENLFLTTLQRSFRTSL